MSNPKAGRPRLLETEIRPDGTFEFTNLYGLWRIAPISLASHLAFKSIEGPAGVVAGPNIDVKPGTTITVLRIVVTDRRYAMLVTTASDENDKPFGGWVLLMPTWRPDALDAQGWGFGVTQINSGQGGVGYYRMGPLTPGSSYLVVCIDVEPSRLYGQEDLMERARAAAVPVEIHEGETRLNLRAVRLRPFVVGP